MSDFGPAYDYVHENEKGISDDKNDHGGFTVDGFTLQDLLDDGVFGDINGDGVIDKRDLLAMTDAQKRSNMHRRYWLRYGYDKIGDTRVATRALDLCFNAGPRPAHVVIQRALMASGRPVKIDGIFGPRTIEAINGHTDAEALLAAIRSETAGFYRLILAHDATQADFINGWINRAYHP